MGWGDVKEFVGKAAPIVGGLLGGPAGGAVGALIAGALGVEDSPEAVTEALKGNPELIAKVRALELTHEQELRRLAIQSEAQRLAADTARLAEVNATMRAELASGDRFKSYWRPLYGYLSAITWTLQSLAIVYVAIWKPAEAPEIIAAIAGLTGMWGIALGVLGITVHQRSNDKKNLLGQGEQGLLGAVARRVTAK